MALGEDCGVVGEDFGVVGVTLGDDFGVVGLAAGVVGEVPSLTVMLELPLLWYPSVARIW